MSDALSSQNSTAVQRLRVRRRLRRRQRADSSPPPLDMWQHTDGRTARWVLIFLGLNFVLYALLTMFFYYTHRSVYYDFSWDSYLATVDRTLLDFTVQPISVTQVPMMIPVLAVLFAGMAVMPLLVAQLFRWWAAVPLLLCLLVLGHLPVMSFYILLGCLVVGIPRLQFRFAYANSLIAIICFFVYIAIATRGSDHVYGQLARPTDRFLLYLPFLFALLICAAVSAVALALAFWARRRPHWVALMLAGFTFLPTGIYSQFVGREELQYRLLEGTYGPVSAVAFRDVDADAAYRKWHDDEDPDEQVLATFARTREEALQTGMTFLETHPDTWHVPNVIFLIARALDMNIDISAINDGAGVRHYWDVPTDASRPWWSRLVTEHGRSVFGLIARQRMAVFLLRDGDVDDAMRLLEQGIALYNRKQIRMRPPPARNTWRDLLRAAPPEERLQLNLPAQAEQLRETLQLVRENRGTPADDRALAAWFRLDPSHPLYLRQLNEFRQMFPNSRLEDNVAVEIARRRPAAERGPLLRDIADGYPGTDGARLALLQLGRWFAARAETRGDAELFEQTRLIYAKLNEQWPGTAQAATAARLAERLSDRQR